MMIKYFSLTIFLLSIVSTSFSQNKDSNGFIVASGQMPNMTVDKKNTVHIIYGVRDSILLISTKDGITFTPPSLVAILPKLMASSMRGPQIVSVDHGLLVTACTNTGNIYCYKSDLSGKWTNTKIINDTHESAKESLMALSAEGLHVFAIWLGVKNPKGQNIYGSKSIDGGKTWTKNIVVYASPDGTVCECCKPSVAVRGNNIFVMFRNFINGNRDLYLIKSTDGGRTYQHATKLGNGSWKLSGCPMDGGGLVINHNGIPETVWQREGKIYATSPGTEEKEIGKGRGCSMETINGKNIYCWSENGKVTVLKPDGVKINLGKGNLPLLKALNSDHLICLWEHEKEIHGAVIDL
jgi:hypothetical protein